MNNVLQLFPTTPKPSISGLRFFKRLGIWRNYSANNTFDPSKQTAHSYEWWCYVKPFNGKLFFNNYNYSNTTSKHQASMRHLLKHLDIHIDFVIETKTSLSDHDWHSRAISEYQNRINEIERLISKPRTHKRKNIERRRAITALYNKIEVIRENSPLINGHERKNEK